MLARSCVRALEPDLVILDEFQRFRDLLDGESEAAELARLLFDEADGARAAPVSATPYKMYTLADERDEDHYADFLRTARFLMGPGEAARSQVSCGPSATRLLDVDGSDPISGAGRQAASGATPAPGDGPHRATGRHRGPERDAGRRRHRGAPP